MQGRGRGTLLAMYCGDLDPGFSCACSGLLRQPRERAAQVRDPRCLTCAAFCRLADDLVPETVHGLAGKVAKLIVPLSALEFYPAH
jgi:hypothetical protein